MSPSETLSAWLLGVRVGLPMNAIPALNFGRDLGDLLSLRGAAAQAPT